jgi:carbamate kinase
VDAVYAGFGTDSSRPLRELVPGRDDALLGELPEGSMRPKVEAAFDFVRATGGSALITSAEGLGNDEAGTWVVPAS